MHTLKNILIIVVVLALAVTVFGLAKRNALVTPITPIGCTMEAKICPDGSAVGRSGPKCEFAPCPSETLCEGGACPEVVPPVTPTDPIACTMEAKQCPDGITYVGRSGPKCEFAECPKPVTTSFGYVAGHITIGPNCPVEQVDNPCPTPLLAYSSREVVVYKSDAVTVKEKGKIDMEGNYRIALPPGTYFIQISPAGIGPGEKKQVVIMSSKTSTIDFDIDTGIR